jgi:predicted Zn finger-like uncharacterized protein
MILTCPNCGTQYVVKDGAIPPQGRQVRCASCKHSWHQDPEASDQAEYGQQETVAEATMIEPRTGPEAEERAYEEAMIEGQAPEEVGEAAETDEEPAVQAAEYAAERHAEEVSADFDAGEVAPEAPLVAPDWREPPVAEAADDEFSPFPAADETAPKRRSPVLTIILLVALVAALAVAFYFLAPPEWKARVGLGGATSQLALVTTHMDRQRLASGNELLTVTGRVINPTAAEQSVPPLQAQLRSKAGKVVYSWTIAPPARTLSPGASASFNSAEVNVPPGGDELTITLGEPKA